MKLTNCKLKKNTQLKLLEYFVLEVTARSAANLLDIHPNTAALFYKKIRQITSFHLAFQASELFDGCIEHDESNFGGVECDGYLIIFLMPHRSNREIQYKW